MSGTGGDPHHGSVQFMPAGETDLGGIRAKRYRGAITLKGDTGAVAY